MEVYTYYEKKLAEPFWRFFKENQSRFSQELIKNTPILAGDDLERALLDYSRLVWRGMSSKERRLYGSD